MKKLGLVGGTGPESTVMYYRGVIAGIGERLGAETLPPITIDSLSPFEVFRYCAADDLDGLTNYLMGAIDNLVASGAEIAALTAATTHIVFDEVRERSPIPVISMIDATVREAKARGVDHIALLGTQFTMTNSFFVTPFTHANIDVTIPTHHEVEIIQKRIAGELEHGIVTDAAKIEFEQILDRMKHEHGVQQVILGCTELPLILNDGVSPVACLDPVPTHIDELVRVMLADS